MGGGNGGRRGVAIASVIFALSVSVSGYHVLVSEASLLAELLGRSLLLLSLGFGASAYYAFSTVESPADRDIIGANSGMGFVLAGFASGGYSVHQYLAQVGSIAIEVVLFQVTFVALVGAVAGTVVGLEKARRTRTGGELTGVTRKPKPSRRESEPSRRELQSNVVQLEESNERLEQFAYTASHDLKEPLRMVTNYLQLIERRYGDDLDEEGREFLEFAVDGADRMRTMIDGLLDYSRVETQGTSFEPVDLDAVVNVVLTDLQLLIAECEGTIEVGDLPCVQGDPNQLRQLFQNLLSNALKYSGESPPQIRISAERNGDTSIIAVQDDGIGIAPDNQKQIFEIFQRLHSREEYEGSGVGLALCRRIVERHDGEIDVESAPGEGATFYVTLPVADD